MSPPIIQSSNTEMLRISSERISTSEILYFTGSGNYTNIHLSSGRVVLSSLNLRFFENNLDKSKFFRVHKSAIVNISFILYTSSIGLIMQNGEIIQVARRVRTALKALISKK